MTYITGQPIFFVGCGQVGIHPIYKRLLSKVLQTYTDLRQLRVPHIVQALLKA